jgi:PIN domain nuclease of toxin-antitoxin system
LILDTTYLLPLAQIAIDTDLLAAIATGRTEVKLEDTAISLISVFELQAKAARLRIPARSVVKAVDAVMSAFRVEPFHKAEIIDASYMLRRTISDYVDCVVLGTAIALKEDLVTEDSLILKKKENVKKEHNLDILSFRNMVRPSNAS